MAEQIYQAITDGHKKYAEICNLCAAQLEERYGSGGLEEMDACHKEQQDELEQSPLGHLLSVQVNLNRAIRKCNACYYILEEERHSAAAKVHPIPLPRESLKQATQRRQQEVLQGTQNTKTYITGTPRVVEIEKPVHQEGQDFEGMEDIGQRPLMAPRRRGPDVDPGEARIGCFPRPRQAPELPTHPHLRGL
jgi:hypothetical protein